MKKMISFLGTSDYKPVGYEFNQKLVVSSFVQIALAEIFQPDEVIVCLTEEARTKNWLSQKQQESTADSDKKLEEIASERLPHITFSALDIPAGQSLDEFWEIFNLLEEKFHDGDTLLVDVTHSFRSIPIVTLACTQYLGILKNVALEGIYYGAYEARREAEDGTVIAPVFDLTSFAELMHWSQAVAMFEGFGDMGGLRKLFDQETTPRRKASKGKDQEAVLLREIARDLDMISQRCATCRGQEIYQDDLFRRIQEKLLELEKDFTTGKAFGPLLKRVRSKLQDMQYPYQAISEEVKRGFESVNWCLEHNLVQQAYTLLRENVVTHFCQLNSFDFSNREKREMVASALRLYQKPKEKWDQKARDNEQEILRVQHSAGQSICKLYQKLSDRRNDINHAGIGQPAKSQTLTRDIHELKDEFMALLSTC